jgi:hypothetical protein
MKITIQKKSGLITLKVNEIQTVICENDSIKIDKTIKNLLDITEILIKLKKDEK